MHIDSLTITALVIFIIMLAVFVRFCMVRVCSVAAMRWHGEQESKDTPQEKRSGDGS